MSDFRIDKITNRVGDAGTQIAGISTFSGTSGIQMPSGPTEYRGGRGRGFFGSGATPSNTRNLDMIEIASTGNGNDWGDDIVDGRKEGNSSFASSTRGVWAGGYHPAPLAQMVYTIMSSQGGVSEFGNLTFSRYSLAGASDSTRGISFGGRSASITSLNIIDFVTLTTLGNANDFGDLTNTSSYTGSGINSPTRAIRHGGGTPTVQKTIDYVTTQSKGDAKDFGELITARNSHAGCSNSTRGLIIAGQTPTNLNSIEYITIATFGNATDFGDITDEIDYLGACASSIRGVNAGGQSPTKINNIEYVTISSTGNVTDFGDLTNTRRFCAGFSDCHGGLG